MKIWMLPAVAVMLAWMALPGAAQERVLPDALPPAPQVLPAPVSETLVQPPAEVQPVKPVPEGIPAPEVQPAPAPAAALPSHDDHCGCNFPEIRILWPEQECFLQRIISEEVPGAREKVCTLEVAYRDEQRKIVNIVVKSRPVTRVIAYHTMKPVVNTDPCTGKCTTCYQAVTDCKEIQDLEFYAVPEEKIEVVKVPYLREKVEEVQHKVVIFRYITERRKEGWPVVAPDVVPKTRYVLSPEPCCPCPPCTR